MINLRNDQKKSFKTLSYSFLFQIKKEAGTHLQLSFGMLILISCIFYRLAYLHNNLSYFVQIKENPTVYDHDVRFGARSGTAAVTLSEAVAMSDSTCTDIFRWPCPPPPYSADTHRPFGLFDTMCSDSEIYCAPYSLVKRDDMNPSRTILALLPSSAEYFIEERNV
jgi:hypothetical protein